MKRMVTLSPAVPVFTTSRRTGLTKFVSVLPAVRTMEKVCYGAVSVELCSMRDVTRTPCKWKGCGAPGAFVAVMGNEISIVELDGSAKRLPLGRRSAAEVVPLRIWRRTGTVGDTKETSLMKKLVPSKLKSKFSA